MHALLLLQQRTNVQEVAEVARIQVDRIFLVFSRVSTKSHLATTPPPPYGVVRAILQLKYLM